MLTATRARTILTMVHSGPSARMDDHYFVFPDVNRRTNISSSSNAIPAVIYDGVVVSEDDVILEVCTYDAFCDRFSISSTNHTDKQVIHPENYTDLGNTTILPAVINCHNHLELSHLRGRTASGGGFEDWIESLLPLMMEEADALSIETAVMEMAANGTAHVGDVTSRWPEMVLNALQQHGLTANLFMEVFGYAFGQDASGLFTSKDLWPAATANLSPEDRKRCAALAGHALYSTHPVALVFAKQWCRSNERSFSMHLAEHEGETELLTKGTGRFKEQLSRRVLPPDFEAPAMRPVPYAMDLGLLDEATMAVHCVQCDDHDISLLAQSGCSICLCPRSNAYIGVGKAPVQKFMEAGIPLCLGTDSLASNTDVNVWNEARVLRDEYNVPVGPLLRMLTVGGAHALGLSATLGTLEPGKRACYSVLPKEFDFELNQ